MRGGHIATTLKGPALLAALAVLIAPAAAGAQECPDRQPCIASRGYVQIGTGAIQPVRSMIGGTAVGTVDLSAPDGAGVVRKRLASSVTPEEIVLTFDQINPALVDLIDAFFDGRRLTLDLIVGDDDNSERSRARASDAQVLAITSAFGGRGLDDCNFQVTLKARSIASRPRQAQTLGTTTRLRHCVASDSRISLDGEAVPTTQVDSFELRGDWIRGEEGTGFAFPNLRVVTSTGREEGLGAWYDRQMTGGTVTDQVEHTLAIEFLPATMQPPALLRLDARGVGMVARRRNVRSGTIGRSEFELYVEEWDRAGHTRPTSSSTTSTTSGELGGTGETPPARAADGLGSFRVQLPTRADGGTGSVCIVGGEGAPFVIPFVGTEATGMIVGPETSLRVGTYDVGAAGETPIQLWFAGIGTQFNSFVAKRGRFTVTEAGVLTSGSFRVVADFFDATGEPKEATITGSFTRLPKRC